MKSGLERLAGAVSPTVLNDAVRVSARLRELGIRHALIGGLAVGIHGQARATRDADFLVAAEAFATLSPIITYKNEVAEMARVGVVDFLAVPPKYAALDAQLETGAPGAVPVMPVEGLILLKLHAHRPQDRADVRTLADAGADLASVTAYLRRIAPDLLIRFAEILASNRA